MPKAFVTQKVYDYIYEVVKYGATKLNQLASISETNISNLAMIQRSA